MTTNRFDCLDAKRRAQQSLRDEFNRRRTEFSDYDAFLAAKAEETPLWREIQARRASTHANRS